MVDLGCRFSTVHAAPVVSFEHYIALTLPFIRFEVLVSVIVATTLTFLFEHPTIEHQYDNEKDSNE